MRTTAARRGRPDRSRAGNFRATGPSSTSGACPTTCDNPRRGYPDRTNAGTNRRLDLRQETRRRLRAQFGPAEHLPIHDEAGKLDADNVEDALQEVATDLNAVEATVLGLEPMDNVIFSGTGNFSYNHATSDEPSVTILDSAGEAIEVQVKQTLGWIDLFFSGTLTNATMLLKR